MSKLIIVMGDLAAGKSTYANILSKRFNIICLNKDNLKETLGNCFGFTNRKENLRLSKCSFELMIYALNKAILANSDLILEANFRKRELELINGICIANNIPILTFFITADIKILHQRFLNRITNEKRHAVHKSVDYSLFSDFETMIEKFRQCKGVGTIIDVNADNFAYQSDDLYFNIVQEFIKIE